jgi:predicted nucleotidyltransferase
VLKQDVENRLIDLTAALRTLGIRRIGIFGSTARGDARPDSDVDLLVEFADGRETFDAFMDVTDLLESKFPVHIDVLTPESFDPRRRARIEKETIYYEIGA